MKVGKMDGYCVGEPWNARAIAEKVGYTAIATQEIWADHPEKVVHLLPSLQKRTPRRSKPFSRHCTRSVWLDDLNNRPELCDVLAKDTYIKCDKQQILGRLLGDYDYGDGRKTRDSNYMIFSQRNCNYPQASYAKWWLTQLRRWGMVEGTPDYAGVSSKVMQPTLFEEAMKELGVSVKGADDSAWTMFDGVRFDPTADCESYAKSFTVNNLKG